MRRKSFCHILHAGLLGRHAGNAPSSNSLKYFGYHLFGILTNLVSAACGTNADGGAAGRQYAATARYLSAQLWTGPVPFMTAAWIFLERVMDSDFQSRLVRGGRYSPRDYSLLMS